MHKIVYQLNEAVLCFSIFVLFWLAYTHTTTRVVAILMHTHPSFTIRSARATFYIVSHFDIWFPIGAVLPWFSHIFHALTHAIRIMVLLLLFCYSRRQNTATKIICNAVICQTICVHRRDWAESRERERERTRVIRTEPRDSVNVCACWICALCQFKQSLTFVWHEN